MPEFAFEGRTAFAATTAQSAVLGESWLKEMGASKTGQLLRRTWNDCPLTCVFVSAATGLFVATTAYQMSRDATAAEAQRVMGAVSQLQVVAEPSLNGPLQLWDGQWWRIPISGFHHGNLIHLLINCLSLLFLGLLLEPRMRKAAYFAFFLCATTLSLLAEFLVEDYAVGLSGAGCAMFGVLLVARRSDERIADVLTDSVVRFVAVYLVACIFLTSLEIVSIANRAHFTGLAYGWLAGMLLFGRWRAARRWRIVFYASHVLALGAAFYLVAHPFWIGRHHWYLALSERDVDRRVEQLEEAVAREPGLRRPWIVLTEHYFNRGDRLLAWKTILKAVDLNRSDDELVRKAAQVWRHPGFWRERAQAIGVLAERFGAKAAIWQERIGMQERRHGERPLQFAEGATQGEQENEGSTDRDFGGIVLPLFESPQGRRRRDAPAPTVDPDAPDSAAQGVQT